MFAGFNLKIDEHFFESQQKSFEEYQKIGEKHLGEQSEIIKHKLDEYINHNVIDGSRIQNDWFPRVNTDIFLSHSSADEKLVNAIAGWLNDSFNLKCFIDSNVWWYVGDIAEMLNSRYSNKRPNGKGGYLYDHEKCLKVSEHVNTMLSIALQKMIDKCESIFLINTEKSIHINNDSKSMDLTYSPWIYSELACSEIVRKKPLVDYRYNKKLYHSIYESRQVEKRGEDLTISYNAPSKELISIDENVLKEWKEQFNSDKNYQFPLDLLYRRYFKDIVDETKKYFGY